VTALGLFPIFTQNWEVLPGFFEGPMPCGSEGWATGFKLSVAKGRKGVPHFTSMVIDTKAAGENKGKEEETGTIQGGQESTCSEK
jgi:hypothetical protein